MCTLDLLRTYFYYGRPASWDRERERGAWVVGCFETVAVGDRTTKPKQSDGRYLMCAEKKTIFLSFKIGTYMSNELNASRERRRRLCGGGASRKSQVAMCI